MNAVSSEVHQDLLFLDSVRANIFDDDEEVEDEVDGAAGKEEEQKVRTLFVTTPFPERSLEKSVTFELDHFRQTEVSLVGLQVWRGALLLSDYILSHPEEFENEHVLELAAGTGLTSIVAATIAKSVTCTDVDRGTILSQIRSNIQLNSPQLQCRDTKVAEIDFFQTSWTSLLRDDLFRCTRLLVADVVYSRDITEQFFQALDAILDLSVRAADEVKGGTVSSSLVAYIAIEKRERAGESGSGQLAAPNFQHFCLLLSEHFPCAEINKITCHHRQCHGRTSCVWRVKRLTIDFHQYFQCYERVGNLHLWKIECDN